MADSSLRDSPSSNPTNRIPNSDGTHSLTGAPSSAEDITPYHDRPSDDGKHGQKANREDAPAAKSSLGNFSEEDLHANSKPDR